MSEADKKQLIELIKRLAKEICYEILEEHLTDYKHERRLASREVLDDE